MADAYKAAYDAAKQELASLEPELRAAEERQAQITDRIRKLRFAIFTLARHLGLDEPMPPMDRRTVVYKKARAAKPLSEATGD